MGSLFSKKKNKVNQHDKAVLDLKVQRDKLKQYQKKCEQVVERETQIARELLKQGKKKQAVLALKKKKYQETLLSKTEGQMQNVQSMIDSIEFAQMEQKVFESLKQGNEVLKEIHSQMTVEDVEQLMQDTAEAVDYQRQIEEALAGKLTEEDEEDVLAELEELEKSGLEESLPSVPKEELPSTGKEEVTEPAKPKASKSKPKEAVLA